MKNRPSAPAGAADARLVDLVVAKRLFVQRAARPAHRIAARLQKNERTPMALDRRNVADLRVEQRRVGDKGEDA